MRYHKTSLYQEDHVKSRQLTTVMTLVAKSAAISNAISGLLVNKRVGTLKATVFQFGRKE